ncbi:hypothetical protein [Pseudomonas aeruginosa]|uniref:hypothetical protein n=1 Tax=Pseudomonas aeruginosa TaxID=287 RepID=UPI00093DB8F9|nr:hypothetical protein [Pseudomonas aeruginosa]MDU0386157.1 hypothetical protein [Pseudomonas aeruginosa]HBO0205075.1 hypothetical protein [Pseudomonas aeruginosa]HBP0353889.1 hypothetical protein [Pseudomonas aeruginosa]HBP0821232.1 hypothetical protein [Pseudomonas aeruginosa]HCL3946297.1 hypothetical protein [Pseudomonas aeruginosa]
MATRAFSSVFKKVKDITVAVYSDYTAGAPTINQERRAVYLDPRGDTCLVIAIPDYVVDLMGTWIGDHIDNRIRVERDPKTGTHYISSTRGIDGIEAQFRSVMQDYREAALTAMEEKVIVIKAAYTAEDANGRRVDKLPSFSDVYQGALVGFNFDIRWRINGKLYAREYSGRLYQCGYGDDMTRDCTVIPWSEAAEATCNRFYQGLLATGQRLHDFLAQDADALALQLENGGSPLLGHVEETKA